MQVIARTTNMSREEWLDLRRKGIGGSDLSIILGKNKYRSAFALWSDKTGRVVPDQAGEAAEWGHDLEKVIAEKFARQYGSAVVQWPVMLQHDIHRFMFANLDFLIVEESDQFPAGEVTLWDSDEIPPGIISILEIKTTGIVGRGSGHLWMSGGVPEAYELQGHHYAIVTGIKEVIFAGLIAGEGLQVRGRVFNSYEQDCVIIEAERMFWERVFEDTPPDVDGSASTLDAIHAIYPESQEGLTLVADDELERLIQEYRIAKREVEEGEQQVSYLRARIELLVEKAEKVIDQNSQVLLTFKSNKPRESLDIKAFKATCPDIYRDFSRMSPGSRVLRLGKE